MIGVVTTDEFPHGLRCGTCDVEMPPGTPYTDTLEAVTGDGLPVTLLVCVGCEAL